MPTRLLLIADTHLPKRARELPEQVWRAVDEADVVVHAGDWVELSLLDELEERASGWSVSGATMTGRSCGHGCRRSPVR